VGLRDLPGVPALGLLGVAIVLVVVGVATRRAWRVDRRTALIFALALATPLGAAIFTALDITTLFSTRNLAASWPALALAGGALVAAAGPRVRIAAAALAIACFAIGASKLLQDPYERPHYTAVANFIERHASPGDVIIDESAVLSPGPLSHLDTVLETRGNPVLRSRSPQQRDHPFNVFDTFVTPEQSARRATALARGARIFLVTDAIAAASIRRPLGSYRLVESRVYPGLLDLVVRVYEERGARQG
jgi:hypothetical protein